MPCPETKGNKNQGKEALRLHISDIADILMLEKKKQIQGNIYRFLSLS